MESSTTTNASSVNNERTPLLSTTTSAVANGYSRRRWLVLFVCAANSFATGNFLGGLIPVKQIMSAHYGVDEISIEWTSYIFLLFSPCLLLPLQLIATQLRIRKSLILVSTLHVCSKIFHVNAFQSNRYLVFLFGQIPAAVAYSLLLPLLTKCSAVWFPLRERTSATSFSFFCCFFGFAASFPLEEYIINSLDLENTVKYFFIGQLILTLVVFLVTISFIRDNTDTGNTDNSISPNQIWTSLKKLVRNRDFMLMSESYGIYCGIGNTLIFLINPLLGVKFPKHNKNIMTSISWVGFALTLVSYLSTLIFGVWVDRFRSFRSSAVMLNIGSLATWLLFTLLFFETERLFLLCAVFIGLGLFALPYVYMGTEHAVELTYPVDERISSALLLTLGNLYTFLLLVPISTLTDKGYPKTACLIMLGLYVLSTAFVVGSRSLTRRTSSLERNNANVVESPTVERQTIL